VKCAISGAKVLSKPAGISELNTFSSGVELTSMKLVMFLAEELIRTSGKHGQTPLDHDGMIDKRHFNCAVLRSQFYLRHFLILLFLGIVISFLGFWQQLSVTSDAVLRCRVY
jgi:hypothetical protein